MLVPSAPEIYFPGSLKPEVICLNFIVLQPIEIPHILSWKRLLPSSWSIAWKMIQTQTWRCLLLQKKLPKSFETGFGPVCKFFFQPCCAWRKLVAAKFSKTAKSNLSLTRRWKPLKYIAANNTPIVLHMLSKSGWVDLQARFYCYLQPWVRSQKLQGKQDPFRSRHRLVAKVRRPPGAIHHAFGSWLVYGRQSAWIHTAYVLVILVDTGIVYMIQTVWDWDCWMAPKADKRLVQS